MEGSALISADLSFRALAKWRLTVIPLSANRTDGMINRDHFKRPNRWWAFQKPSNSPGTATASPPVF
jgi:hypothetical protein